MPAEPVPLIGSVSALEVAKTRRSRSFVLVEHRQELRVEVAEHRSRQRHRRPRDTGWTAPVP